jgi:hypothetical protein
MKGMKLTAGILVAAMMITSLPVEALASKSAESDTYITGTSVSFSAGATAAINETVVLNDTKGEYFAEVTENEAPVVAEAAEPTEATENTESTFADFLINLNANFTNGDNTSEHTGADTAQ